eukprot:scaffold6184_cov198-Ochromonas_danica.AAC.1
MVCGKLICNTAGITSCHKIYPERVSITVKAIRTEEVLAFCQKALTLFKQKHGLRRSWTDVIYAVVNLSKIRLLRLCGR